ncbi:uncharacterized protein LOC141817244 isoform X2 [Curcuma longa]|uniref:uncharacterized protein LOC141817244 isoform X2 n=1 Tax=Curcuma longa TaxID=136217 RepID=UPI003D9E757D
MKMAGSTRMESTSSSMDGTNFAPAYQNGQRGTHLPPGLERSGSFRESMENRSLFAGPGTLRNAASSSEVPTVSQYLPLDTLSWGEQKFSRTGEIRRVLGVTVEDHTFGSAQSKPIPPIAPEDIRRLKGIVYESSNRARERSKSLQDLAVKLDRYRNLVSRKRQRIDQSNEKSGMSNPMKMGNQTHQSPTELASPRLEDRKNAIPNKRIRSSMAEVRSEVRGAIPPRQGVVEKDRNVLFEKDKTMLRGCNGGSVPTEDKMCGLPPMGDGWDKKMKRKRSVGLNRVMESDREIKSIQQRPSNESRMRSSDAISFRPGLSNGTTVSNKMDGCSQPSVSNSRGTPKIDLDSDSIPNERREFSSGVDNERIMHKGGNKLNVHDDGQAGNQSALVKGKASRGPRTVLGASMNSSPSFLRSSGNIDGWEQGTGTSKVQSSTVANRKRPVPNESSSPPVTQWVGQRPQKISRTRRVNVVSPVSNLDEAQFLAEGYATPEVGGRMTTMDNNGLLVPRAMPNKLKHDNVLSPAVLSESEESAAVESKFKDKGNDSFELEDGAQTSLKASSTPLPTKKNKTPPKEEIGDGVRRQGRSGRSSLQSKSCLAVAKEKMESIDATKPLKNKKMGPERSESRIGRPPSKKMTDRKAYARPQIMTSVSSESAGTSTDDCEDLLASANDARSASCRFNLRHVFFQYQVDLHYGSLCRTFVFPCFAGNACSNSFWKKMEPIFASPTLEEISFVKRQIHFAEEVDASLSNWPEANHEVDIVCDVVSPHSSFASKQTDAVGPINQMFGALYSFDGKELDKTLVGRSETKRRCHKLVPLSQRLLSAFISEDEAEKLDNDTQDEMFLLYSSDYIHNDTDGHVIDDDLELDYKNHKRSLGDGFVASNNFKHLNIQNILFGHESLVENNAILKADNVPLSDYLKNNCTQIEAMSNCSSYGCQFEDMPLDDRILMELQSIGLFPESVPDLSDGVDGEIDKVISELQMRLLQQVRQKKDRLSKLEKAIQDAKEIEERKLEKLAMDKLVEMACKRLTGGRGSSNHKTGITKVAKQLAMAFAKRTLERCHIFEKTGRSCFSESTLRDVLLSAPPNKIDTRHTDGFGSNGYVDLHSGEFGVRQTGLTTVKHGLGNKMDRGLSDPYQSVPQMGEHSVTKRKKEVLLDDVTGTASRSLSTHAHSLATSTKWKKSEREQEQNKDASGRSSTAKAGRPSLGSGRGERKLKTKPKQKIAQLSTSGNGLGRVTETDSVTSPALREAFETVNSSIAKFDQEVELQTSSNRAHNPSKEFDDGIFTNLPLNGIDPIDELDVADGLGGQGQDIASWLNVDEEALLDQDLVGLEIPMDDLSDLKLNF